MAEQENLRDHDGGADGNLYGYRTQGIGISISISISNAVPKQQSMTEASHGGVQHHPGDVPIDRKIGSS